jgi:hypothetical protein
LKEVNWSMTNAQVEVFMRGQAFLFASALVLAGLIAAPAQAQSNWGGQGGYTQSDPWCAQQRQNRMLAGAAIGGIAGAVIGKNVAARKNNTEGAVLGGVTGAAAGALIGRSSAQCQNTAAQNQPYYGGAQQGYDPNYNQGGYYGSDGLYGAQPATQAGYGNYGPPQRADCRWGTTITRDPDGREMRESVYMCRGSDGIWRRAN